MIDFTYLSTIQPDVAKDFEICRITSARHLEELLSQRRGKALFGVDDTEDGALVERGGAYYDERELTLFFIMRYNPRVDSLSVRAKALERCRRAFRALIRRVLGDIELELLGSVRLDTPITYHELPGQFLSGYAGLYASLPFSVAIDLSNPECHG